MEIVDEGGKDNPKTLLKEGSIVELGRKLGFNTNDKTVSRRHISLHLHSSDDPMVTFEVIGKNPIWVHNSKTGETRVYTRSERGKMDKGDKFCLSAKNPIWFTLKASEFEDTRLEDELADSLQSTSDLSGIDDLDLEAVDFSNVDPVKEFGFVVKGMEFEGYPKTKIRDIKDWDWFLEESGVETDSDDDEVQDRKGKKILGKKRRKGKVQNEDDEWVGESDEDKKIITKSAKVQKPKYSTRSKDRGKIVGAKSSKKPRLEPGTIKNRTKNNDDDEDDDDEDDETLGGFIVDDEDAEKEVESDANEDEEEEEFEGDDDEDED